MMIYMERQTDKDSHTEKLMLIVEHGKGGVEY